MKHERNESLRKLMNFADHQFDSQGRDMIKIYMMNTFLSSKLIQVMSNNANLPNNEQIL